jgi:hypothetical protein
VLAPTLVLVYGAGVAMVLLVWLAARISGHRFQYFSRDPTAVLDGAWYTGSLSNIGVLLWWTGAVAASLAGYARRNDSRAVPLVAAGVFTGWLALDDLFLLHETVFPLRGVSEELVVGTYALIAAAYAWLFREFLRSSEWILLVSATPMFAASVVIDLTTDVKAWEDSAKFVGIVGWTAFLVRAALFTLTDRPSSQVGEGRSLSEVSPSPHRGA